MKTIITGITVIALFITSCGNDTNSSDEKQVIKSDTSQTNAQGENGATLPDTKSGSKASIEEVVVHYLHVKNALTNDNGKDAADGGKAMVDAIANVNKASLTAEQKKVVEDVIDDTKEHAEHISVNGSNIKHQREHFDMLSKDVYDLVKTVDGGQTLYQEYCPMYNNNKGATWLSETREIRNPYLGKEMLTCGEVKEEIKQ